MTGPPRISVCILSYNYERYVGRAVESALAQEPGDYRLEEVVVSDDGSDDATVEVCGAFGGVTVRALPHRGFATNLSESVVPCRGDWIAFLDADDWFTTQKLRTVAPHLRSGALLVQHAEHVVDAAGEPVQPQPHPGGSTSTLVVNRAAAVDLLPVTNELFFHILHDAGHGVRLDDPLTHYRVHDASMTDRRRPGRYQTYMAEVCLDLARRLDDMAIRPPAWARAETLRRLSSRYRARSATHASEATRQETAGTLAHEGIQR